MISATSPAFRSNHGRAQLVIILFAAFSLLDVMLIGALVLIVNALNLGAAASLDQLQTLQATAQRLEFLGKIQIIAYIVTGLAFLFWIHRAYQNLSALDTGDPEYSPRWAVGGFFVPFLNLVRPYQIVSEIWLKSEPDPLRPTVTPPLLIKAWWAAFIVGNVLGRVADTSTRGDPSPEQLLMPLWLTIISLGLQIIAALTGSLVIKSIDDRQEQRLRYKPTLDWQPDAPGWNPAWFTVSIGLGAIIAGATLSMTPTAVDVATLQADRTAAPTAEPTRSRVVPPPPTVAVADGTDHVTRSRHFLDDGKYNMAASELSLAIKDKPYDPELYYLRGLANSGLDSPEAALRDFNRAIELKPKYAEAYYERGLIHLDMENYGLAGEDFETALRLKPKYVDAYIGSGWTHYLNDEYSSALSDINRALALDDEAIDGYHVRGMVYLDTGKFGLAIDDFTRAIKLEPTSAVALNRRGMAFHAQGDLAQALADFNQALDLEPDFIDVYFNRGLVKADQGSYAGAVEDFTRVIDEYPDWGPAYIERAAVYGLQLQYDLAIVDLEEALKLELDAADRRDAEQLLTDFKAQRRGQSS